MRKNIMKKIIAAVCTVSMVMGSTGFNAMAVENNLEIIKQPTSEKPTVEVNKTEDVSYQWYKAGKGQTYSVENAVGKIVGDTIIGACYGCGEFDCETDGVWTGYNMGVYLGLEAGDIVKVIQEEDYGTEPIIDGIHAFENEGSGVYKMEVVTATKTEVCIGICEDDISGKIEIVRDGITYRVVNGCTDIVDDKIIGVPMNCSFDNGVWKSNSQGELRVDVYLKKGQTLKVTTSDDCDSKMNCYALDSDAYGIVTGVDNEYKYTATEEGIYMITFDNATSFTAQIKVDDVVRGTTVSGQTTNTLTRLEEGAVYSCLVSYGNEEVWSDYMVAKMIICKQPTPAQPTVQVNYPDAVQTYQWYNMGAASLTVVDKDAQNDELEISDIYSGVYTDGKWESEDEYIDIAVEVNKGDKVVITLPQDFEGSVYDRDSGEGFECINGTYEYEIDSQNDCFNFVINSQDDFTADIKVISYTVKNLLENETSKTLSKGEVGKMYVCCVTYEDDEIIVSDSFKMEVAIVSQPIANNPTVKVNFEDLVEKYQWHLSDEVEYEVIDEELVTAENKDKVISTVYKTGIYEDGKWTAVPLNKKRTKYDVWVTFEVEEGELVKLVLSPEASVESWVALEGTEVELECIDGVYYYKAEESGEISVDLLAKEEFTVDITTVRTIICEAISGQVEKVLHNHKAGKYICRVILEDDTELISDMVTIAETDFEHAYTDIYDADCNGCGAIRKVPDRPVEPDDNSGDDGTGNNNTPNAGDNVNVAWLLAIAVAAMAGLMLVSLNRKRA